MTVPSLSTHVQTGHLLPPSLKKHDGQGSRALPAISPGLDCFPDYFYFCSKQGVRRRIRKCARQAQVSRWTRRQGPTTSDGVLVSMVIELGEETNWLSPGP